MRRSVDRRHRRDRVIGKQNLTADETDKRGSEIAATRGVESCKSIFFGVEPGGVGDRWRVESQNLVPDQHRWYGSEEIWWLTPRSMVRVGSLPFDKLRVGIKEIT